MAENITSLYDIYNRDGDVGKATDIQSDDLVYLQRGTGSNRDKCIKGSDILKSSGLVIVNSTDTEPYPLYNKLDDSTTIVFQESETSGHYRVKAFVKHGSIDTDHLKSSSVITEKIAGGAVTTAKIAEGAVTESRIALNSIQEQAIKDGAVTENKLGTQSVSTAKIKAAAVKAVKLDTNIFEHAVNDFVTGSGPFESLVTTYTAVNARGFLDVTVDLLCGFNSTSSVGFSQVALEIRDHDSGTVLRTYSVGVPEQGTHYVKRFIVRNADTEAKNYDLFVSGTFTDSTQQGVSPTIGDFVSTGIVFN